MAAPLDVDSAVRQLQAAHKGTRSELATYTSEVAALRRDVHEMRDELAGARGEIIALRGEVSGLSEVIHVMHGDVQSAQRSSLQVQRGQQRAHTTAVALGPSLLVLFELGRWLLEHLAK